MANKPNKNKGLHMLCVPSLNVLLTYELESLHFWLKTLTLFNFCATFSLTLNFLCSLGIFWSQHFTTLFNNLFLCMCLVFCVLLVGSRFSWGKPIWLFGNWDVVAYRDGMGEHEFSFFVFYFGCGFYCNELLLALKLFDFLSVRG